MVLVKKFKAVIVNPDRTTEVKYIGRKVRIGANAFYLGKNKKEIKEVYIINPNHTIITTTKRLGVPFNYQTCYYKRNIPVAVPINEIEGGTEQSQIETVVDEKREFFEEPVTIVKGDKKLTIQSHKIDIIHPISMPQFEGMAEWDGITSEEMASLFNPQFYKMIAKANVDKKADQMWLMQIGTLAGIGFIIYYIMNSLPKAVVKAIAGYLGGG